MILEPVLRSFLVHGSITHWHMILEIFHVRGKLSVNNLGVRLCHALVNV